MLLGLTLLRILIRIQLFTLMHVLLPQIMRILICNFAADSDPDSGIQLNLDPDPACC